jgi:hypothetical protein
LATVRHMKRLILILLVVGLVIVVVKKVQSA